MVEELAADAADQRSATPFCHGPGEEPLRTQSPVTLTLGTDGHWFMQLVRVPFSYTETV